MANNPASVLELQASTLEGLAPKQYSESANAAFAFAYFINQGWSAAQASGIVGNLIQESGVNPESQQSGGPGMGIAQWSNGGRWSSLGLSMSGNNATDLVAQLYAVQKELNANYNGSASALRGATSPSAAADVFGRLYEQYGIAGNRVQDAVNFFTALPADVQSIQAGTGIGVSSNWFNGLLQKVGAAAANVAGSSPVASVVSTASSLASIASDIGNVTNIFTEVTSAKFWDRILLFAGGSVLFLIGLFGFISQTKTGQEAESMILQTTTEAIPK